MGEEGGAMAVCWCITGAKHFICEASFCLRALEMRINARFTEPSCLTLTSFVFLMTKEKMPVCISQCAHVCVCACSYMCVCTVAGVAMEGGEGGGLVIED